MKFMQRKTRRLSLQPLETRRVLAASLGWDGPGLGSVELTYTINGSPNSLSQAQTNAAIETALAAWSSAADIEFTPTNQVGLSDSIDISFVNIDGASRTLAQAYFPDDVNPTRIAGDIQFDLSESWEVGNSLGDRAFDLVWVAVHEIGHSLGLDHQEGGDTVLAPSVSPNQFFTSLSSVDADAVQQLYAAAESNVVIQPDDVPTLNGPVDDVPSDSPTNETPSGDGDDDPGDSDDDPFPRNRWRHGGRWHRFGGRLEADLGDFNYLNPTDVNGDNATSAIDALMIINQLNRASSADSSDVEMEGLCDVNGDGGVSALDALTVINSLHRGDSSVSATVDSTTVDSTEIEVTETLEDSNDLENSNDSEDSDDSVQSEGGDDLGNPIDDGGRIDDTDDDGVESDAAHHHHGHQHGHHRTGNFILFGNDPESFITRLDTDEEGSLSEDEVSERLWTQLIDKGIDTDADGLVTLAELETAIAAARDEVFNSNDADGDGLISESEVSTRYWAKVSAADVDRDRGVSRDECDGYVSEPVDWELPSRPHRPHHVADAVFGAIGRRASRWG